MAQTNFVAPLLNMCIMRCYVPISRRHLPPPFPIASLCYNYQFLSGENFVLPRNTKIENFPFTKIENFPFNAAKITRVYTVSQLNILSLTSPR